MRTLNATTVASSGKSWRTFRSTFSSSLCKPHCAHTGRTILLPAALANTCPSRTANALGETVPVPENNKLTVKQLRKLLRSRMQEAPVSLNVKALCTRYTSSSVCDTASVCPAAGRDRKNATVLGNTESTHTHTHTHSIAHAPFTHHAEGA